MAAELVRNLKNSHPQKKNEKPPNQRNCVKLIISSCNCTCTASRPRRNGARRESNRNSPSWRWEDGHLRVGPEAEDVAAERGDGGVRAVEPVLRRRLRAQAAQEPVYAVPHGGRRLLLLLRPAGSWLARSPALQEDELEISARG